MPKSRAWIIKLGGSLAGSPALGACLRGLAASAWPCVVVPGGGVFARTVRDAQANWAFDDAVAHRMAILAMAQFGLVLAATVPGLKTAELPTLAQAPAGEPVIWLPRLTDVDDMDRVGIPNDWSVSSDSLALWLGQRLESPGLVLIKSCSPELLAEAPMASSDSLGLPDIFSEPGRLFAIPTPLAQMLANKGVVDSAFPRLAMRSASPALFVYCVGSVA